MQSKLVSCLIVITSLISVLAIIYNRLGTGVFIEFAIIGILALILWLSFSIKMKQASENIVAFYLLAVVAEFSVLACRYGSDFAILSPGTLAGFYANDFNPTIWFMAYISGLTSLFLLGGYFLIKSIPVGLYLAWFLFLYNLAEVLIQVKVDLIMPTSYSYLSCLGVLSAVLAALISMLGCFNLLKNHFPPQRVK